MVYTRGLVLLAVLGTTFAFAGEFVPKSFYIIDQNGHKSDVIELRNRRDLLPILRARRSDNRNTGSSGGQNPYNPGSASGDIVFGNIPNFATPEAFFSRFAEFADAASAGGAGAAAGVNNLHRISGSTGAAPGPAIFSRSGEAPGNAVLASGQAAGPNGAFSSSSVSSDGNGKVTYSTKSGKY